MPKPFQPKNTHVHVGSQNVRCWVEEQNKHKLQEICPEDMLMTEIKATLAHWLGRFRDRGKEPRRQAISSEDTQFSDTSEP